MGTDGIVEVDILADALAQLLRAAKFIDIDQFGFEAAEPALDHDVVRPAGLAVHALANVEVSEQLFVFITGKLAALV